MQKTISLVLGSGGARGLAHIGVIRWLEENGYEIKTIVGCSIGSLVGGVYAAGKLDLLEEWMRSLSKTDILLLMDLSWEKGGFVKGDRVINTLKNLIGETAIEELKIPYTAVAVNIEEGREVWIQSGSLFDAIRASSSMPLFFTPFDFRGAKLIDGGVLNPVPIAPTLGDHTDLTVAVNLGAEASHSGDKPRPNDEITPTATPFSERIASFIKKFQTPADEGAKKDWSVYDIAVQSFETMQNAIARQKIAAYPPDVLIGIPRNACTTFEFDRAAELIELGYQKTKEAFER